MPAFFYFSRFSAPIPPTPFPLRGRGRFLFSYARGFAPCIPGAEPGRRGLNLRWRRPAGGLPSGATEQGAKPATGGGTAVLLAGFSCRIRAFLPPSPRPPSPFGEGGDFKFSYARGFAPCIPGAEPERHGLKLPWRCPTGACPAGHRNRGRSSRQRGHGGFARRIFLPYQSFSAPIPPTPFPGGEGGVQGYFMQGASPLASPGLNPGDAG